MKNKITNNLGMKALSLCLAVLFWLLVINIDDPVRTRQFTNVPVSIINEDAVATLDKVYEVVQGKTVDITVSGKKSLVDKVTMQDLQATADLSQLSMVNAVNIYPECTKYPSLNCSLGRVQTMKVSLENMRTDQFVPVIQQVGTVADGYYVVNATSQPNIIKVTGAKSQVRKISEVRLEVDASNAKATLVNMAAPRVFDVNGEELEADKFKFSVTQAKVELDIRPTKTIPVTLEIDQHLDYGYECTSMEYEPKRIMIAGKKSKLAGIEELTIPINLSGWTKDGEMTINVAEYLPSNITVSAANPVISVQLGIEKWGSRVFYLKPSDIEIKGKKKGRTYEWLDSEENYTLTVYSEQQKLDTLSIEKIKPYINVKNLKKGRHEVTVEFEEKDSIRIAPSNIKVEVRVS